MSESESAEVPSTKGHWRKGRSRNLDPTRVAQGRVLTDLLRRAVERGWRHPSLGVLSLRVVGRHLGDDHSTVSKWCRGVNLPPRWAMDKLRLLLQSFSP